MLSQHNNTILCQVSDLLNIKAILLTKPVNYNKRPLSFQYYKNYNLVSITIVAHPIICCVFYVCVVLILKTAIAKH